MLVVEKLSEGHSRKANLDAEVQRRRPVGVSARDRVESQIGRKANLDAGAKRRCPEGGECQGWHESILSEKYPLN